MDFRLSTLDFRLSTFDFQLLTFDFGLSTLDFRLWTFDFQLSDFTIDIEKNRIFEKQLVTITGKNYPMGIEELILEQERKARTIEIILASYDEGLKIPQIARITQLAEEKVLQILVDHGKIS